MLATIKEVHDWFGGVWPNDWLMAFPNLNDFAIPNLDPLRHDMWEWKDMHGLSTRRCFCAKCGRLDAIRWIIMIDPEMLGVAVSAWLELDSQGSVTANGSGGETRADVNADGSASMHAAAVPTTDTENPKEQVTRESVFKRLTFSNVKKEKGRMDDEGFTRVEGIKRISKHPMDQKEKNLSPTGNTMDKPEGSGKPKEGRDGAMVDIGEDQFIPESTRPIGVDVGPVTPKDGTVCVEEPQTKDTPPDLGAFLDGVSETIAQKTNAVCGKLGDQRNPTRPSILKASTKTQPEPSNRFHVLGGESVNEANGQVAGGKPNYIEKSGWTKQDGESQDGTFYYGEDVPTAFVDHFTKIWGHSDPMVQPNMEDFVFDPKLSVWSAIKSLGHLETWPNTWDQIVGRLSNLSTKPKFTSVSKRDKATFGFYGGRKCFLSWRFSCTIYLDFFLKIVAAIFDRGTVLAYLELFWIKMLLPYPQ
ncbi:hypothetical protein L6452_32682 [Arctium lappa]|uniref:Uncharacterized protein n=1 Tax=Arctium lappa TaxID=4217 RepID=A0ACB8Z5P0_ARCLA|nr:hypothetical protein L6452_32682 [Arctium lappa]